MQQINVFLIDDEQEALDAMEILLSEYSQVKVLKKIINPIDVFPFIEKLKPDLLFLDINMPLINGIDLLAKIREHYPALLVVIVSAYDNYSMPAVKLNAFSYLLKPVNRVELRQTIENVEECLNDNVPKDKGKILIKSKNDTIICNIKDVECLKASGNYTEVYMNDGNKHIISNNLGTVIADFPKNEFIKVNRSLYVKIDNIKSINKKQKTCTLGCNNNEIIVEASLNFIKEISSIFKND